MTDQDYPSPMDDVTVLLSRPINVEGEQVQELTLTEPTVKDLAAIKKIKDDMAQDLELIGRLAKVPPPALKNLTAKDFGRLQKELMNFLGYGQ